MPPGYDRCCRNLTAEQRKEREAAGIKPVVRFKVPTSGRTKFHDEIWGDVVLKTITSKIWFYSNQMGIQLIIWPM